MSTSEKKKREKKDDIIIFRPKQAGKNLESYIQFFEDGKKGVPVTYMCPQGNFLTPAAQKRMLQDMLKKILDKNTDIVMSSRAGSKVVLMVRLHDILEVFKEKGITL